MAKKKKVQHGRHPHPEWFFNSEQLRSTSDAAKLIAQIGEKLADTGTVNLNDTEVTLPDECTLVLRYERLPHGELALKIELMWEKDGMGSGSDVDEVEIS